eukprot:190222-Hanusia_phi.AAC.7
MYEYDVEQELLPVSKTCHIALPCAWELSELETNILLLTARACFIESKLCQFEASYARHPCDQDGGGWVQYDSLIFKVARLQQLLLSC